MPQTITYNDTLVVEQCPTCHIAHGVPRALRKARLAEGGSIYCPNGHAWHFTQSQVDTLRAERDLARQSRDWAQASAQAARDQARAAERRASAARGQVTKIRNRVANGVCPCCHRSFANMLRHMQSQHPGYPQENQ